MEISLQSSVNPKPHLPAFTNFIHFNSGSLILRGLVFYSVVSLFLQVVELDFLYPSEGIHRRWDSGYRITSTAATWDQAALILSVPKRKIGDETQETLRTSAFPSTHVKVKIALLLF